MLSSLANARRVPVVILAARTGGGRGMGRDREMEGGTLSLIPFGSLFLLQLIYSSEEWLFAFTIFYSRLTRHRGPQAGKASKRTINMFY